ncbi:MAG: hypothetical protein GMKNLPBB_02713 [Myxococcota bacterium]|nr:hypothetical protein [Myxococcota bacterium]
MSGWDEPAGFNPRNLKTFERVSRLYRWNEEFFSGHETGTEIAYLLNKSEVVMKTRLIPAALATLMMTLAAGPAHAQTGISGQGAPSMLLVFFAAALGFFFVVSLYRLTGELGMALSRAWIKIRGTDNRTLR